MLKEKNKVWGLVLPDFKIYCKGTRVKTVWFWWNNRQIDQWNRKESPDVDPSKYSQLIFDKVQKQYNAINMCLQQMVLEQLDIHMQRKKKKERKEGKKEKTRSWPYTFYKN